MTDILFFFSAILRTMELKDKKRIQGILNVITCLVILLLSAPVSFAFCVSQTSFYFHRSPSIECRTILSAIEGLCEDFDSLCDVDETIQSLKQQLPSTLSRPLTALSVNKVYDEDFKLAVLLPGSSKNDDDDELKLLQSREELISLSDVLVLATTAAQQAMTMWNNGQNNNRQDPSSKSQIVRCQLLLDKDLSCIRIPWKAQVPVLGSGTDNRLEGLSEFLLNSEGKVRVHRIRKVTWNGNKLNGPEIGQKFRAIQSATGNIQRSPFFPQNSFASGPGAVLWKELSGGILEQAATAASARLSKTENHPMPQVYQVKSIQEVNGWITNGDDVLNFTAASPIPLPGMDEWSDYVSAHLCLTRFYEEAIPMLAGTDATTTTVDRTVFAPNITFLSSDGAILMTGNDVVANFYQSLSLARRGTGQSWKVTESFVLDWKKRSLIIDYEATNTLPPWNIQGRDAYILDPHNDRPIVQEIQQLNFKASSSDGNLFMDSKWLMNNLVGTVKRGRGVSNGVNVGEILSDLLAQQSGGLTLSRKTIASQDRRNEKLSEYAAANVFYIMETLLGETALLFNETSDTGAPAAEFMLEQVELHGYLGEALVRGRNIYDRAVGTVLAGTKQLIAQKRLLVEKCVPPRVELTHKGAIRLFLVFYFRLPPPGVGLFSDATPTIGAPLKIELVSDYILERSTGMIKHHAFVETRVNGQLTPGDVISRWIQRFLKLENDAPIGVIGNDDFIRSFTDAMTWFRTLGNDG
jgi:hypothetical protein